MWMGSFYGSSGYVARKLGKKGLREFQDIGARQVAATFQHDEVVVHCPKDLAEHVVAAVGTAADDARRLLFGDTAVRFPLGISTVECYADAK